MSAYRLARREPTQTANAVLQPLERACHSLRTAPCLGRLSGLCIGQYHLERVQVRDFVSWQAPWLLQLDTLRLETRAWLEQAAWLRPNETNRVFRLLPRILDQKGLIATRIKAQLIRESDKTDVVAEAFYPSLSD